MREAEPSGSPGWEGAKDAGPFKRSLTDREALTAGCADLTEIYQRQELSHSGKLSLAATPQRIAAEPEFES